MRALLPALLSIALLLIPGRSEAQFPHSSAGAPPPVGKGLQQQPVSGEQPVTFTADSVTYDRERGIVTASGHVEAWQNDHVLRADKVVFDRNTNVAAASGHVTLTEPDGEVFFSDYAELTGGMRDIVLRGLRAILAENAKIAATGVRRTGGQINELARVVYSTCNTCAKNPEAPPLWQLRAYSATHDVQNKQIEYRDAFLDVYGIPVMYFPFFWHADPSVKRASGFLIPSVGVSKHIGAFLTVPYYWVIDDQSDATITPTIASSSGPALDLQYRRRFNAGTLSIDGSIGRDEHRLQGDIFAHGQFNLNDTWRYGFDINRTTSSDYLRDFRMPGAGGVLTSQIYAEGFGEGAYSRVDTRFYQALTTSVSQTKLPVVLPRYEYSFFGKRDPLGGRLSLDVSAFNVLREVGTNTQRAGLHLNWERPFTGQFGDLWKLVLDVQSAAYIGSKLNQQPNWYDVNTAETARAQPNVALNFRWPFWRDAGRFGTQVIEPIAQVVAGPIPGNVTQLHIPIEDSLDFEFTDANLFAINHYPGLDRQEGGLRAQVALHGAWYMGNTILDGLVGQMYRADKENLFPTGSGLQDQVSDVVARASVTPTPWLDVTSRFRFDHKNFHVHFADALATVGRPIFQVTGGYVYSSENPYFLYDNPPPPPASFFTPRNEITLGASTRYGPIKLAAYARRDLQNSQMVAAGAHASYENECLIFDVNFFRRYTSINNDHGATTVLFQITLKTVGQFGFHAF